MDELSQSKDFLDGKKSSQKILPNQLCGDYIVFLMKMGTQRRIKNDSRNKKTFR